MFDTLQRTATRRTESPLDEVASEDRSDWLGSTPSERVIELLELRERLDAELLAVLAQWDRSRAWEADGSLSAAKWLEHRTPVSPPESRWLVKLARLVDSHPAIADGLATGELSTPHVDTIARAVSKDRAPLLADHAETIVEQAGALTVREFSTVMQRWASLADDALASDTFDKMWQRRHVHASVTMDGWVAGDFLLDPAAGQGLLHALDHAAPPDPHDAPDGPRSLSQRRADALADITTWYSSGAKPGGNPPNVNIIVDVATANGDTPTLAKMRCDIEGIGPVTRATLRFLTCNATLTRVVMAGDSEVLDLGRAARFASPSQRRAVSIRDRHCRFPGCDRQPRWCDVHHIAGWFSDNGPTDIDNLILLCRRHHMAVESTKWTITRTSNGGYTFTRRARRP